MLHDLFSFRYNDVAEHERNDEQQDIATEQEIEAGIIGFVGNGFCSFLLIGKYFQQELILALLKRFQRRPEDLTPVVQLILAGNAFEHCQIFIIPELVVFIGEFKTCKRQGFFEAVEIMPDDLVLDEEDLLSDRILRAAKALCEFSYFLFIGGKGKVEDGAVNVSGFKSNGVGEHDNLCSLPEQLFIFFGGTPGGGILKDLKDDNKNNKI